MKADDTWGNAKPGQLRGYDKNGDRIGLDPSPEVWDMLILRQQIMYEALESAQDALEELRRGHGIEVSTRCFPALNLVRDAVELCAAPSGRTTGDSK